MDNSSRCVDIVCLQISVPLRLAKKVTPGMRSGEMLDIVTNVWGMIPSKNIPVYCYDFRVMEEYAPRKGNSKPLIKEVTKQIRSECVFVDLLKCKFSVGIIHPSQSPHVHSLLIKEGIQTM